MTPLVPTTAVALRAAIASTIACSPQELEQTVGQIVVAVTADLPEQAIGSKVRSVRDLQARTTVLLADRIPEGEEAKAAVAEIKLWHGVAVAQTVFGKAADELLAPANPRRFAITSSSGSDDGRRYWHGHAWSRNSPERLYTAEQADAEVERLRAALPYDRTIQSVDHEQLLAMNAVWIATFNPAMAKGGYGEIPMSDRQTEAARAIRAAAVELADQAVREAGFADFKGWKEWSERIPEPSDGVGAKVLKNALGNVAVPPFYIWANDDCANKTEDFKEAKAIRLALFNEGGENCYIADADGIEVVDPEIEEHEVLAMLGYFAGARLSEVNPGLPGAFMVNDPQDPDGYAIVGDDIASLIKEAYDHLVTPTLLNLPTIDAVEALAQRCLADAGTDAETRFGSLIGMSPERFVSEVEGGHARSLAERLAVRFSGGRMRADLINLNGWLSEMPRESAIGAKQEAVSIDTELPADLEWGVVAEFAEIGVSAKGFFVTSPFYDEGQINRVDPTEYWGISEKQANLIVNLNEELPEAVDGAINAVCHRLQMAAGMGDGKKLNFSDDALRNKLIEVFAEHIVAEVNGARKVVLNEPLKRDDGSPSPGM